MKRTFDNSVMGGQSTAGQISAGVTATKDTIYYNTNMVNIQREDVTPSHGIATTFNQTRVLPIVGRTNRAEIALKSADIQTKSLPIFQPQVQLGTDVNRLIYELGMSSTWRNTLIALPPNGSDIDTLADRGSYGQVTPDTLVSYYGESTLYNDSTARTALIDTYNIICPLSLITLNLTHTSLSVLFDYWLRIIQGTDVSEMYSTCLTPLVIPSVRQHIVGTSYVPSGVNVSELVVEVSSTTGYEVGDRVRLFGFTDTLTPNALVTDVFATVLDTVNFDVQTASTVTGTHPALVLDYPWKKAVSGNFVFTAGAFGEPDTISFQNFASGSTDSFSVGSTVFVTGNPSTNDIRLQNAFFTVISILPNFSITCSCNFSGTNPVPREQLTLYAIRQFNSGYVINQSVNNGGHIEFLTDEYEFRPLDFYGSRTQNSGTLTLIYNETNNGPLVQNRGFWRGWYGGTDAFQFQSTVEVICDIDSGATYADAQLLNGYYSVVKRTSTTIELLPISKTLPQLGNYELVQFTMKLAPNFYTVDTSSDEVIDPIETSKKYNLLRTLGYRPTDTWTPGKATYPPTASIPTSTWSRAYTVNWDFSSYRNIEWVPQDTTAPEPSDPIVQQDFGVDAGSTYYNVYEFNKFLNDCVNKTLDRIINDQSYEILNLDALSLNGQLSVVFQVYSQLFQQPASTFLWDSLATYQIATLVVSGVTSSDFVFISTKMGVNLPIPKTPTSSPSWMFLGYVPYQSGDSTPYALCIQQTTSGSIRQMSAQVENGVSGRTYVQINLYSKPDGNFYTFSEPVSTIIPSPLFQTAAPQFHYDNLTLLSNCRFDGLGFGTTNVIQSGLPQSSVALFNYKRRSWGYQGTSTADEWFTLESNSSFKFLLDNFPSYCTSYVDSLAELRTGETFPQIEYWIWDHSSSTIDPRTGAEYYEIYQTSESLSSCMSPVQSIVVVSENIPVVDELSSPVYYLVDSDSSSFASKAQTISLTEKIIGEVFPATNAPYNSRSVIHFEEDNFKFVSLLDTRLFKQLEYSVYYRHRITQQLVPLILTNYGNVNIKFVFRPIS